MEEGEAKLTWDTVSEKSGFVTEMGYSGKDRKLWNFYQVGGAPGTLGVRCFE